MLFPQFCYWVTLRTDGSIVWIPVPFFPGTIAGDYFATPIEI
jgi:hypothetical protein